MWTKEFKRNNVNTDMIVIISCYSQAVFLDDLGRNVKAASEVGMITVRVRETEKALIKLETLLGIKLTAETGKSSRQLSKL